MHTANTQNWRDSLARLNPAERAVLITVTAARGSVPRPAGTRMLVTAAAQFDSIGGGHLEWKAIAEARLWLAETTRSAEPERRLDLALGPSLGQCCGGALSLMLERVDYWSPQQLQHRLAEFHAEQAGLPQLLLFGAGHVGSALVNILQQVPCQVTWVDERDHLFPENLASNISVEATDIPEAIIARAPAHAYYLVMTHHHGLDLLLTEHILRRPQVAWFGLIGSKTKRARFEHRLLEQGVPAAELDRMVCPVGVAGISGKEPGVIAVAVAAQLLQLWSSRTTLSPSLSINSF